MHIPDQLTQDPAMAAHVQLLERMGPPQVKPLDGDAWSPENQARLRAGLPEGAPEGAQQLAQIRCACEKWVPVSEVRPFHTGLINALDNVCPGCRKAVEGFAILVCARCRAVVARVQPNTKPNGFRYLPGKSYHLDCCAVCVPDIVNKEVGSLILEEVAYMKKLGKSLPAEWEERQKNNPLIL